MIKVVPDLAVDSDWEPFLLFLQPILRISLLVLATIYGKNRFIFIGFWDQSIAGQGHHVETTNENNDLGHWFASIFLGKFSRRIEKTDKKSAQRSNLLVFLLASGNQTIAPNFAIPNDGIEQMAHKNNGSGANPKQI